MKVLFLADDFPPESFGGAGISTYELASGMKEKGHEVFVITTCRKEADAGVHMYNGLTVFKIQSDYPARWRAYKSLNNKKVVKEAEKIFAKVNPDVIHANNIHYHLSYALLKVAKEYTNAVIFTARDVLTFAYGKLETKRYLENLNPKVTWLDNLAFAKKRWNPLRNIIIRKYLRYAKIIAISNSLKEALERNKIKPVEVIYNGIDVNSFLAGSEKTALFKARNGLEDKKVLLFSGRLSAQKGGGSSLEALKEIIKKVPDTVLLIAGSMDAFAKELQKYAEKLGVKEHIVFTGWMERDEIKIAYGAADIVLMPSICLDTFGRVNVEAMAAKKPVIGTKYGGTPEVIENGVTGYIVDPRKPKEIAEKAVALLQDPTKAKTFGEAGYKRAKTEFNLGSKIDEYLNLYKESIKNT